MRPQMSNIHKGDRKGSAAGEAGGRQVASPGCCAQAGDNGATAQRSERRRLNARDEIRQIGLGRHCLIGVFDVCRGGPGLYIAEEVADNRFKVAGGAPGMRVSWQVTGVRQDAWANAHRIPVEEPKSEIERGHYIHPELFDQPEKKGIQWARHPDVMRQNER